MIRITDDIALNEEEIKVAFTRSSGPGGQNVNKVATAVQLRFDVVRSPSLPDPVRERLLRLAGRRINKDGELVIEARRHRTQEQNRRDALLRLIGLVREATAAPKERRRTRPGRRAGERRLEEKRRRGLLKQSRKPVNPEDG